MNVFYVDKHPVTAAEQMCDKHIVKMILEISTIIVNMPPCTRRYRVL